MRYLSVVCVLASACAVDKQPTTDEVVTIAICPAPAQTALACAAQPIADGSTTVVRVCAPLAENRRNDLKATLRAHAGKWAAPTDAAVPGVIQVSFGAAQCKDVELELPTTPGVFGVEAELEGYVASAWVSATPATIESVSLSASPQVLPVDANTAIAITFSARSSLGRLPSSGTRYSVEVVTNPLNEFVVVTPSQGYLRDGAGSFTVNVGASVTSATVTVTVSPPVLNGMEAAVAQTASIKIPRI